MLVKLTTSQSENAGSLRTSPSAAKQICLTYWADGYDPGTGAAFSVIRLVDVGANEFVSYQPQKEAQLGSDHTGLSELQEAARRQAAPRLERYGIVEGNAGTLVYRHPAPDTAKVLPFKAAPEGGEPLCYWMWLDDLRTDSEECHRRLSGNREGVVKTNCL
jgi:hypothetical protein